MKKIIFPLLIVLSLFTILYCLIAVFIILLIESSVIYVAYSTIGLLIILMSFILILTLRHSSHQLKKNKLPGLSNSFYSTDENIRQKMKTSGRIISRFSHDINNMIHAILGYCELSQDEPSLSEDLKDYLQEIANSAEDADKFVKRIQMFGRKKPINAIAENPMETIEKSYKESSKQTEKQSQLIIKENLYDTLFCDPILLQKAFYEIFKNSFDFSDKDEVEITVDFEKISITDNRKTPSLPTGDYIAIKVSDNGNGISKDAAPYVFDPYFTTDENSQKGTGLSVAWSILNRHEGLLSLTNPEKSEFTLLLPAGMNEQNNSNELSNPEERKERKELNHSGKKKITASTKMNQKENKKTVFLVEDNKAIRKQIVNTLKKAGFEVLSAATGEKANKIYNRKKNNISLLLLDIMLPDIDGIQLCKRWGKKNNEIPVLFCTGYDEEFLKSKKLTLDKGKTIFKPFTETQLINRINDCV